MRYNVNIILYNPVISNTYSTLTHKSSVQTDSQEFYGTVGKKQLSGLAGVFEDRTHKYDDIHIACVH